jgi:hypothetical protein
LGRPAGAALCHTKQSVLTKGAARVGRPYSCLCDDLLYKE